MTAFEMKMKARRQLMRRPPFQTYDSVASHENNLRRVESLRGSGSPREQANSIYQHFKGHGLDAATAGRLSEAARNLSDRSDHPDNIAYHDHLSRMFANHK